MANMIDNMANLIDSLRQQNDELLARSTQKLLTLQDAVSSKAPCVYLESKNDQNIRAAKVRSYNDTKLYGYYKKEGMAAVSFFGENLLFETDEYGKTWRCWALNPTQEERNKEKWN